MSTSVNTNIILLLLSKGKMFIQRSLSADYRFKEFDNIRYIGRRKYLINLQTLPLYSAESTR